ncbi:two-component system sensor histidine kinase NblS [Prochlorothrix hollandica]|uniref:two-component system sensor histidine kinase NblS n=1 Tax=Prochlorothrix hollandica TaxID=1223 RepID=UPI00334111CC
MLTLLSQWKELTSRWWSEFTLQTKLMAAATLVVSLIMSGLTFWAVNSIQQDARFNDTRFGSDLGLLLAANVAPLVAEENLSEVAYFSQRFYDSTSSISYMLYADIEGNIFLGIPFSNLEVQNSLTIQRRVELPDDYRRTSDASPVVRQHLTPQGEVTDVFVPLIHEQTYLGVLAIGINPNATVAASSHLTRDVTIAVFISIWVMVILGAVFNALTITKPIKELLLGVKSIASGNFKQRIDLPLGGELGGLIASFNEMAERLERYEEQNIEELTAEKAKLETLVATIADGAILLDTDMRIVLANSTARRIFNWDNRDLAGVGVLDYLPLEVCNELRSPLYELVEDGPVQRSLQEGNEFRVAISGSTTRTVRMMLTTVLDQQKDHIRGVAITVQDITREVELNEAKSQFISNVSHELRTPLFNIKSFIETLHDFGDELNEEERREFLATANNETDRLTRLVNDVLDLSRLESDRTYHFTPVELTQAVDQTLRSHQLNAKDKGIELCQDLDPDLLPVRGNYDLLLQVFANLVGNALKFTPAGGRIMIRAYPLGVAASPGAPQYVRIEISDTGIGIEVEDQQAIFDRFFRVENRVHTLEGTGLGLAIVRNIVDKHHSKMHLVSEVGVGTTFWMDLEQYPSDETPSFGPQSGRISVV